MTNAAYRTNAEARAGRGVQRRTMFRLALALAAAGWITTHSPPASAHATGLAFLDLSVEGSTVKGSLDVPAAELAQTTALDGNHDGALDAGDIARISNSLAGWLATSVRLVSSGKVCDGRGAGAELRDDMLVTVHAVWTCPAEIGALELSSRLADTLGEGQSTFVKATKGEASAQALLQAGSTQATLELGGSGAAGVAGRFVLLGMEHIYSGIDHVLFLLTLLMLGGRLRRILAIATAFTVAHSITLSLAALGVVEHVPSAVVESAIALSIAWVAVENYLVAPVPLTAPEPFVLRYRWAITFAFGLVHGFGFASALKETGLPQAHLPLALAMFNVGVELGQVTIIAAAWPLLARATRTVWYRPRGVQVASLGVFAVALYWFVQRAF